MNPREAESAIVLSTSPGRPKPDADLDDNAALRDLVDDAAGHDASGGTSTDYSNTRFDQ